MSRELFGFTIKIRGVLQYQFFRESEDEAWEAAHEWAMENGEFDEDIDSFMLLCAEHGRSCVQVRLSEP